MLNTWFGNIILARTSYYHLLLRSNGSYAIAMWMYVMQNSAVLRRPHTKTQSHLYSPIVYSIAKCVSRLSVIVSSYTTHTVIYLYMNHASELYVLKTWYVNIAKMFIDEFAYVCENLLQVDQAGLVEGSRLEGNGSVGEGIWENCIDKRRHNMEYGRSISRMCAVAAHTKIISTNRKHFNLFIRVRKH